LKCCPVSPRRMSCRSAVLRSCGSTHSSGARSDLAAFRAVVTGRAKKRCDDDLAAFLAVLHFDAQRLCDDDLVAVFRSCELPEAAVRPRLEQRHECTLSSPPKQVGALSYRAVTQNRLRIWRVSLGKRQLQHFSSQRHSTASDRAEIVSDARLRAPDAPLTLLASTCFMVLG
jgi:hypothetical protein